MSNLFVFIHSSKPLRPSARSSQKKGQIWNDRINKKWISHRVNCFIPSLRAWANWNKLNCFLQFWIVFGNSEIFYFQFQYFFFSIQKAEINRFNAPYILASFITCIGPVSFPSFLFNLKFGKCISKKEKLNFKIQKTNYIIQFAQALTLKFTSMLTSSKIYISNS